MLLQNRQKWQTKSRNLKVGDVVLLKDDALPRNAWSLARVKETEADHQGIVRAVQVKTRNTVLRRPVSKLVFILEGSV